MLFLTSGTRLMVPKLIKEGGAVSDSDAKARKKEAKARVKETKALAKAAEEGADVASVVGEEHARRGAMPEGVGVSVRRSDGSSELVVSGLSDEQLRRIVPGLTKEVVIAVTEDRSPFLAWVMRFVREGVFQTVVKIIAGLVVGYLLIRFGLG
jgi:hypothetical protein